METFAGQVAVVTGAASGIGAGLALALAEAGADVVLADINSPDEAAAMVRATGHRAFCVQVDVTDRGSVALLAERAYAEFGRVNLLCSNAGVVVFGSILEIAEADWDWVLGVNLRGLINVASEFVPRMLAQDDARHVLVTASGAGLLAGGPLPLGAYTTSKFAAVGYSEALAAELAASGIGLTILCPGSVATGILDTAHYSATTEQFRPPQPGAPTPTREGVRRMTPREVAALALAGVLRSDRYVLTHPEAGPALDERARVLAAAVESARVALQL